MPQVPEGGKTSLKPLKWYKSLASKKGRLEAGAFLVEGNKAIEQISENHPQEIIEIIALEGQTPVSRNYPIRFITRSQLRSICLTGNPQGNIAVVRFPRNIYTGDLPVNAGARILLLEDVQDPGNVGTLIRTAAAFNFSGIILTEKCADPLSPKSVQSTAGSVLSVWIRRTACYFDLVGMLKKRGYRLISADLDGTDDPSILHTQDKLLLALGNESAGLSKALLEFSQYRLRIPIVKERVKSLNVAACGAICMYLSSRKT